MNNVLDISLLTNGGGDGSFTITEATKGSYRIDGTGATNTQAGAAYLFQRTGSTWTEAAKLEGSTRTSGDEFGYSVAVAGDYAVVGAPGLEQSRGAIFVFHWSGSDWDLVGETFTKNQI